ncbi:MAG: 16S rRNA (guanine(966)-N(2))-methyltransferase RsmD [Candidatus Binatia bacterium]
MRVIAGTAKGRRLRAVRGTATRPTADRVKEALFSMLESRFALDGAMLLDLFAGTGGLGLEGASRGARGLVFVEHDRAAQRVLQQNVAACGFSARSTILPVPVARALRDLGARARQFDGVLMDPPYGTGLVGATLQGLTEQGLVATGGWVAVEHHVDDGLAERVGDLQLTAARRYGKTALALYSKVQAAV